MRPFECVSSSGHHTGVASARHGSRPTFPTQRERERERCWPARNEVSFVCVFEFLLPPRTSSLGGVEAGERHRRTPVEHVIHLSPVVKCEIFTRRHWGKRRAPRSNCVAPATEPFKVTVENLLFDVVPNSAVGQSFAASQLNKGEIRILTN